MNGFDSRRLGDVGPAIGKNFEATSSVPLIGAATSNRSREALFLGPYARSYADRLLSLDGLTRTGYPRPGSPVGG